MESFNRAISLPISDESKNEIKLDIIRTKCLSAIEINEDEVKFVEKLANNNEENQLAIYCLSLIYFQQEAYIQVIDLLKNKFSFSNIHKFQLLSLAYLKVYNYMSSIKYLTEFVNEMKNEVNVLDYKQFLCFGYSQLGKLAFDNCLWEQAINYYEEAIKISHKDELTEKLSANKTEASKRLENFEKTKIKDIDEGHIFSNEKNKMVFFRSRETNLVRGNNSYCYKLELEDDEKWYKEKCFKIKKVGTYMIIPECERKKTLADTSEIDAFIVAPNDQLFICNTGHHELFIAVCQISKDPKLNKNIISTPLEIKTGVKYAGCIIYKNGEIHLWNNGSGHFKPYLQVAEEICKSTNLPYEKFYSIEKLQENLENIFIGCDSNYRAINKKFGFCNKLNIAKPLTQDTLNMTLAIDFLKLKKKVEKCKKNGNNFTKKEQYSNAIKSYKEGIALIEKSPESIIHLERTKNLKNDLESDISKIETILDNKKSSETLNKFVL